MVGPERRSMAPFFAGFTNKHELFDFVDAGDDILATKGKIKGMRAVGKIQRLS